MKPITNILLIVYIVIYIFLPLFDITLMGGQTGLEYTSQTISESSELSVQLFSLLPFIVAFGAISINCMKNRRWGIAVAVLVGVGLYFYTSAHNYVLIEQPEFFKIASLGIGFYLGVATLLLALVSAVMSVLPFKFNKRLAHEGIFSHKK